MSVDNAKIQASRAWRNQETSECRADSEQRGGVGQASEETRGESIPIYRDDRARRNFIDSGGQTVAGGIFDRLISKTRHQIKESEQRTADLKEQLEELEQLFNQFSHTEE